MLTGILKILRLPPQCTFWRFLASPHLTVAGQILRIQWAMSQRVWQAAHVDLKTITLDTGTTVHTLFGDQMTSHPYGRWSMNCTYFQLAMLAYNLNCWLMLFNREEEARAETLGHTTLATARLKFLSLAARIWRHVGRVGVSYSDHYPERPVFERLTTRLRSVTIKGNGFVPVITIALRC